jgi:hypothetical protein
VSFFAELSKTEFQSLTLMIFQEVLPSSWFVTLSSQDTYIYILYMSKRNKHAHLGADQLTSRLKNTKIFKKKARQNCKKMCTIVAIPKFAAITTVLFTEPKRIATKHGEKNETVCMLYHCDSDPFKYIQRAGSRFMENKGTKDSVQGLQTRNGGEKRNGGL